MSQPPARSPARSQVTAGADDPLVLRRQPSQRRSREKVERILECATTLIAEGGSDAMRMSEVAARAGISIGALYQYFPDKSAIIRALAERCTSGSRHCIEDGLRGVHSLAAFRTAFGNLIDTYYALFLAEPVMRDIWSGTQADPALRQIELADSRATGAILADVLAPLRGDADRVQLDAESFLVMHLGEATMRLAVSLDRAEGDTMVEAYKEMVLDRLCG